MIESEINLRAVHVLSTSFDHSQQAKMEPKEANVQEAAETEQSDARLEKNALAMK